MSRGEQQTDRRPLVLLVDDEPRILSSLQRTLRKEPYDIATAAGVDEAMGRLEAASTIDVVVSDQRMPGRSGIELLKIIAQRWPTTERILLSGWTGEIPGEDIEAARLFASLPKPWDEEELKSQIREALHIEGR